MTDAPIVEAHGLGRRYRRRWALRDCTLAVPAGRVVGLVGVNGAGKSTLLHLIVGLATASEGRVEVLGAAPGADADHRGRVGFVAQSAPLYPSTTVLTAAAAGRSAAVSRRGAPPPGWRRSGPGGRRRRRGRRR